MRRSCSTLLVSLLAFGLVLVGCDSGGPTVPKNLGDSTSVSFTASSATVEGGKGLDTVQVEVSDPGFKAFGIDVTVDQAQSTAKLGDDIRGLPADTTLFFEESTTNGTRRTLTYEVTDNFTAYGEKDLVLSLSVADTVDVSIGQGVFALTVQERPIGFSDGNLAPMSSYSVSSQNNWEVSSEGGAPNVPYAVANGFGANEVSNDWLITPALNFNDVEGEVLTFLNAKGFNDSGRRGLQVKVSTDYDGESNPEDFSWTDVSGQVTFSGGDFNFVESGEVDLSGSEFQGDEVYIAFQYQNSDPSNAAAWEVDNIAVTSSSGN